MSRNLVVVIVAFSLSVLFNYIFIKIFKKIGIVDKPDGFLKPHSGAIPLSGGISIFLSFLILDFLFRLNLSPLILIAFFLYFTIGFIDDTKRLNPIVRLFLEIAAFIPLIAGKIYMWNGINIYVTGVFTLFLVIGYINSFNLMDGLDGLSGTLAVISLFSIGILSCSISCGIVKSVNMILLPVILGFLMFNYEPAKAFLGDGGAYSLGFLIAYAIIVVNKTFQIQLFLASLYMIGIFIYDTFFAIFRRICIGKPIFSGDRSHVYDILKDSGKSVDSVIMIMSVIQIVFSVIGFFVAKMSIGVSIAVSAATIFICALIGIFYIERFKKNKL